MFDWLHTQLGFSVALMALLIALILTVVGYSTFFERKVAAWIQDRIGPNRAGPRGLLQPLADGIKFLFKEEFIPAGADRALFILAPMIAMVIPLISFAVIPWGGEYLPPGAAAPIRVQVASLDIGLLYVLAFGAMGVYGVVLGSWASNNKYSLYGGLRAAAQMLSYEVPMGLAILVVVLTSGHLRLESIVEAQLGSIWSWNVFLHPVTFLVLFVTALAETNRAPFDLAECEQELVGGFHTEYSAMKFAMFFLGEYTHMVVVSALMAVLFFGGWHFPGLQAQQASIAMIAVQFAVMWSKVLLFIFVFMWIRWTLPRLRFDQLMERCWKGLVPLMMCNVAIAAGLVYADRRQTWWAPLCEIGVLGVVLGWGLFRPARITGRQAHLGPVGQSTGVGLEVPS